MARWADIETLSEYLDGRSLHSLRKWTQQGWLPHHHLGRRLMFDLDEIDEWIRNPTAELAPPPKSSVNNHGNADYLTANSSRVKPNAEATVTSRERAEAEQIAEDIWSGTT